jgi:PAS domain S-box-containing protein
LRLSWTDLTLPEDVAVDRPKVAEATGARSSYEREKRYRRRDGSLVWCHLTVSPQWGLGDTPTTNVVVLQDITARVTAEEALREIEARLNANLRITSTGHAVVRVADRKYLDCNEAWLQMFGYRRDEVIGRTAAELGLYESPQELQRVSRLIDLDGRVGLSEIRLRRKSGEIGEFLTNATPLQVEGATCMLAVIHDVTAFNAAERARRESEERYRTLFNLAPSGVVLMDEQGKFLAFNDVACEIAGWSREEFAALSLADVGSDIDPAQRPARFEQLRAGKSIEFETSHRRRDGALRDVLIRARMIQLGGEARVLAVWNDVTSRRQTEAALRRSGERFRALIEKSTDMTILLDAGLRTSFWSPSATAQLGWAAEDLATKGLLDLVHGETRAELESSLGLLQRTPGEVVPLNLRAQHKDGTWRDVHGTCRNLLDDRAVGALVVNARDVTAERSLERQLQQSQKLESVGRLAGGVAHDFNNLLTVILSCTEQLESDLRSSGTANLEDVEEVREAGARAGDLTGQLLAFSRRQVLTPQALSLDEVLASSEKLLRRVLGEDIALVVRPGSAPWAIFADRGQLDQIFVNLAVNARDAMPDGGTLTVETATEPAGGKGPGEWVCLRVTDSGTGMSPEVRERLFEPFFTTKPVGKGTGLGLATVHGIVSQSGGVIRVDSALGRGTTFEVCFPRSMAAPARPASGPLPMALRGTETVLLIEDDAQVRGITAQALQKAGYKVLVAADGEQAVGLFGSRSTSIDLVISDVVMPGMNGRRTVEELRRSSPDLKALFVSGYTHDVISGRGVLDSGLQFLSKPFTPNTLLARVREVLAAKVS